MKYVKFTNEIKSEMKLQSMSLRKLSSKTGIDFTLISRILNHERNPPSDKDIRKIARALDLDYEYLMICVNRIPPKFRKIFENHDLLDFFRKFSEFSEYGSKTATYLLHDQEESRPTYEAIRKYFEKNK